MQTKICPVCEHTIDLQGKHRSGFEYPFLCMVCNELAMNLESYEEELTEEQKREI